MRLLSLFSLCGGLLSVSCEQKSRPLSQPETNMKRDAEALAKAMRDGDFETTLKYMPRRLIDMGGGDAGMIKMFKKGTAEMDAQGTGFHEVTVGDPEPIRDIDGLLVGMVPQRIVMKAPGGRLITNNWSLALSGNGGREWVFISMGKLNEETLPKLYPELVGKIEFRPDKPPIFEKD